MQPALFACVAANEAEKVAPNAIVNDIQMMGASGRIFMSDSTEDMLRAKDAITQILSNVKGRTS